VFWEKYPGFKKKKTVPKKIGRTKEANKNQNSFFILLIPDYD